MEAVMLVNKYDWKSGHKISKWFSTDLSYSWSIWAQQVELQVQHLAPDIDSWKFVGAVKEVG